MGRTQSIDLRHSSPEVSPTLKPYSAGPQFLAMKQVPLKPASPRSPVPVSLSGSEEKAVQPYAPMNNSGFMKHRLIGLEHYRRMASMKIPELQRNVQSANYNIFKKDQEIQALQRLIRIYEGQQKESFGVQAAELKPGRASVTQRAPRTKSLEFQDQRPRSSSNPNPEVPGVSLDGIVEAQKRRIQALKSELMQARQQSSHSQEQYRSAVAYKGKVREEFRSLHAELHGQQQALVKARREVRRLVGKRSEERMAYERLLVEHHELQTRLGLPLKKAEVPAQPAQPQGSPKLSPSPKQHTPPRASNAQGKRKRNRKRNKHRNKSG